MTNDMDMNAPRKEWQVATLLRSKMVADDVKSLVFSVEDRVRHRSGQHYDIRLTAPDGYRAERSYSVASAPEDADVVEFGVQLLAGGEVSPYLFALKPGGKIEVRGPIGGHFVWENTMPGPLMLVGGGSGVVPLLSMLRHYLNGGERRDVYFLVSARSLGRVTYRNELELLAGQDARVKLIYTLTDNQPPDWQGYARRIDKEILVEIFSPLLGKMPMAYICGPTPFVEAVADNLVNIGFHDHEIKTERFGGGTPAE